ncbi:MAG: aspartate aminotransferase family protein [Actinomycetota bacterium]|nr:aspartate aminotransferase family protein [Actinomycetota bacterium]
MMTKRLPPAGVAREELLRSLRERRRDDADWRHGRIWSLVYHADEGHSAFLAEVYRHFFAENGLSPTAFPSLRKLEAEVVAMLLGLVGARGGEVGSMTSGGSESILLAVKAYRDRWRAEHAGAGTPEMVVPASAHPAFLKAAAYFDLRPVVVPVGADFRADPRAVEAALGESTACIVASAPSYPQGVVDPVAELGRLALAAGVGLHVDACLGGMLLPFLRRLGHPVPGFDFAVPGVTSISVDLHKYGYAAKGASAVLYRDAGLHQHQFFVCADWPGGLYGSPTMAGTRSGGIIAAAWAALMSFGEEGYLRLAGETMELTERLVEGIAAIPGLRLLGRPDMSVLAFSSDAVSVLSVARRLEAGGWRIDRQRDPDAIHMIVTPNHRQAVDPFLEDLARSVAEEREHRGDGDGDGDGEALLYGVTAEVPAGADREAFLRSQMSETYRLRRDADGA